MNISSRPEIQEIDMLTPDADSFNLQATATDTLASTLHEYELTYDNSFEFTFSDYMKATSGLDPS